MHRLAAREVPAANHEALARPTAVRISPIDGTRVQFCSRQRHASIMAIGEGKHEAVICCLAVARRVGMIRAKPES